MYFSNFKQCKHFGAILVFKHDSLKVTEILGLGFWINYFLIGEIKEISNESVNGGYSQINAIGGCGKHLLQKSRSGCMIWVSSARQLLN